MSTTKRPGSPLEAIDVPPTKRPDTAQDTAFSGQAAFVLEFLPEDELPHRQEELTRLNNLIHDDIKEDVAGRGIGPQDVSVILLILDKHCDFVELRPLWRRSLRADEQALDQFLQITQDAYKHRDYSRLMLIKGLQRSPQPMVKSSSRPSVSSQVPSAIVEGWNAPFIGTAHIALARTIQKMFMTIKDSPDRKYTTHATIVQSSGSGKSRLVDKVAETVFTIPFNVREARDPASGAWPPADDYIRNLLVRWSRERGKTRLYARYLCFFTAVFEETRKEMGRCIPRPASAGGTASDWRTHLAEKESEHRNALYTRVVKSDAIQDGEDMPRDVDSARVHALRKAAQASLKQLLNTVCPRTTCHVSHTGLQLFALSETASGTVNDLHVLVYFDEAHVLANQLGHSRSSRSESKSALDILFAVLDDFRELGLFAVFISSQPRIEHLESTGLAAYFPSSAHGTFDLSPYAHAPITETPFDCFGDRRIVPSRLRADDVCDVAFMACFGRPMWRSLLLPFCDTALANASGTPEDPSLLPPGGRPSPSERRMRCECVVHLAQAKLVFEADPRREQREFCQAGQTAVLDVRIMLPFDPRSSAAQRLQLDLAASHMRTIYSVPQHREYVRSGYSSKPILAEAAARQLHLWRKSGDEPSGCPMEPEVVILFRNVNDGLLDREEIGGVVGRLLLTLARDRACLAALPGTLPRPCFSRAVPVNAFIKALFPPAVAHQVLDSKPDNLPASGTATTFAEAFEDAVLNFTHFARWEDDSVPDEHAAVGCFVRSMAVVCGKHTAGMHAFIPILLDKSARIGAQVMTGILIRFTASQRKTAAGAIDDESAELFDTPLADGQTAPLRPYITLVMELGISDPAPPHRDTSTAPVEDVNASEVPVPVDVGQPPIRGSDRDETGRHPRYSITAYGCSRSVYQVIGEEESRVYERILRKGDPLSEHQRQDAASLYLVQAMKPEFSNASWARMAGDDGSSMDAQLESMLEDSDED